MEWNRARDLWFYGAFPTHHTGLSLGPFYKEQASLVLNELDKVSLTQGFKPHQALSFTNENSEARGLSEEMGW